MKAGIKVSLWFLLLLGTTWGKEGIPQDDKKDIERDESEAVVASRLDDEADIIYKSPKPSGPINFADHFDDVESSKKKWIISKAQKEENAENVNKYEGKWEWEFPLSRLLPMDKGLVMKSKAKLHAIAAKLQEPFDFKDKPLILQYEVNFQSGMDCGGAYVKLLSQSKDLSLNTFNDKTPYTIMFGPDKCGSDMKVHFIFRHKNPVNGTFSEKHSKRPSNRVEETYGDKKPHLYRLKLTPDNRFEVFVDDRLINSGSLLEDMEPKVNPPMEIEDPNAVKPADWDEREKILDPTATKPDDWDDDAPSKIADPNAQPPEGWLSDEPEMIPDPAATQPEDWDEAMDGTWEPPLINNLKCAGAPGCGKWNPPMIDNPNFRGKWKPPMISNPNYKGKWNPPMIPNPDYFEDKEPFKMTAVAAIGLELWTMSDQVLFDNFIISSEQAVVDDWTSKTWELKRKILEKDNEGVFRRILNYSNKHPWLWAVYVLVVAIPVVVTFAFCCGSSPEKLHPKKTDEPMPDDDLVATDHSIAANSGDEKNSSEKKRRGGRPVSKDDLEETNEAQDEAVDANADSSMEEEENIDAEEEEEKPSPPPQSKKKQKGRRKE